MWQKYKKGLLPVFILIGAFMVFGALKATRPIPPVQEAPERSWPVAVQTVQFENLRPEIRAFGEIRAGRTAELRARVSGNVVFVDPEIGDGAAVLKDQLLFQVDDFDYISERDERLLQVEEALARLDELNALLEGEKKLLPGDQRLLDLSKREVARQQQLQKSSAGTRKALDDALSAQNDRQQNVLSRQQAINQFNTQIVQANSALNRARAAWDRAARDVEDTKLIAPFVGFLADLDVAVGKQVSTSDRLGQLIALDRLEVTFHVSERDYAQLTQKAPLQDRLIEVRTPAQTLKAQVVRIDARIDAQSGGRTLFAALTDLELTTELRPGLFVEVRIPDQLYENVVKLPKRSLHEQDHVYLIGDDRLEKRSVDFIETVEDTILITAGLEPGDQVVLTRFAEMGAGLKVDVK